MGTYRTGARASGSGRELNRRRAVKVIATGAVGAATTVSWVESLNGFAHQQAHSHAAQAAIQATDWNPKVLTAHQNELVIGIAELIIPATDTPGAKAARVNRFIDSVLHDAPAASRTRFVRGLEWVNARSHTLHKKDFVQLPTADQTSLLSKLADERNKAAADRTGVEFFRAIKSMTIDGYYTSEIGLMQELGDNPQMFLAEFPGCDHPEHQ